jgi:RHS repeat-associated protein
MDGLSYVGGGSPENKYLYNGKEQQDDKFGEVRLDWYDYGKRFYEPALGRWHVNDPLADSTYSLSPYHYVDNNPLIYIDPYGLEKWKFGVSLKLTSGKIGVKGKIYGIPISASYARGGAEQSVGAYFEYNTETGGTKAGMYHKQTNIYKESAFNISKLGKTKSSTREIIREFNTKEGAIKKEEKIINDLLFY